MKKIVLTAAALLIAAGTAYAGGNDNVGNYDINKLATANVDSTNTSSVHNANSPVYKLLNSSGDVQKSAPQGSNSDHDVFGNH